MGSVLNRYSKEYRLSMSDPVRFWSEKGEQIDWIDPPKRILSQDRNGSDRWFEGGKLNTSWLALDRHIGTGRGHQTALIYDSPVTQTTSRYSFLQLTQEVARVAGALSASGVQHGDRVLIYMPMVPEAVMAMLACARIGAIHSVVFGGFAAAELASRIEDAQPKVILTATCGIETTRVVPYRPMLERALLQADHSPDSVVVLQREQCPESFSGSLFVNWDQWSSLGSPKDPVPLDAWDPLYILYTSGTTGKPKGVVRDNGGHAVALNYSMDTIYGCSEGDVFWAASDIGWVVGHSYIVYAPLIKGCTTILYEGKPVGTPDASAFWRVISDYNVKTFFVAPTAFRAIKKEDPECRQLARYTLDSLEYLFVAGERLDPPTWYWLRDHLKVPVIDHWWQTESGWAICANMIGFGLVDLKPGSVSVPVPGYDVRIVDSKGTECPKGDMGNVVVQPPLPPGNSHTLWGNHERFKSSYWSQFPGAYATGDGGFCDKEGYVYIMGRTDDVINVAGHRLSTGELEETLASHAAVAEAAVVGIQDDLKGQVPIGLVVLKDGSNHSASDLEKELTQLVRQNVGAFANFRRLCVVARLPKTRSGKILRQVMRKMIDGEKYTLPSTIEDPDTLEEIRDSLVDSAIMKVST